ncbi:MAG: prepilin-type N-terminal cleavage/methylation domain-containing protein [Vampirovibrionales bacterium]
MRTAANGFTLLEAAIVIGIIAILSAIVMGVMADTETADAAMVRSAQSQLEALYKSARLHGPVDYEELEERFSAGFRGDSGVTFSCVTTGPEVYVPCSFAFTGHSAELSVYPNAKVQVDAVTGFTHYAVVDGELVRT